MTEFAIVLAVYLTGVLYFWGFREQLGFSNRGGKVIAFAWPLVVVFVTVVAVVALVVEYVVDGFAGWKL